MNRNRMSKLEAVIFTIAIVATLSFCAKSNAGSFDLFFQKSAGENRVSAELLTAICWVESKHNPYAFNKSDPLGGAVGICQLLVPTASWIMKRPINKLQLFVPKTNIEAAAKYLAYQVRRYRKKGYISAISAYNAGHLMKYKVDKVRKGSNGKDIVWCKAYTICNIRYVNKVIYALIHKPWSDYDKAYYYEVQFGDYR